MMFKPFALAASALAISTLSSHAEVVSYWSFNDQDTVADIGTASLSATWFGFGPGTELFAEGTSVNAQLGYGAGTALGYVDIVTAAADHRIEISGLNFSSLSNVSLSFAVTSTEIFEVGESATVHYKIGAGSWSDAIDLSLPDSSWRIDTLSFGSLLDDASNVSIRIDYHAVFDVGSSLRFDNVTVTAVPEPQHFALAIAGVLVAIVVFRRKARRLAA